MIKWGCQKVVLAMKKKRRNGILFFLLILIGGTIVYKKMWKEQKPIQNPSIQDETKIQPTVHRTQLTDGLSVIRYDGDYGFQAFIDAGGASSDEELLAYLMENVLTDVSGLTFFNGLFGCSTIQARNAQNEVLFGRNFDWQASDALIVQSKPVDAYASIATVNLDFIQQKASLPMDHFEDDVLARIAMYVPLDGINEKGLAVSVNMIQDQAVIEQTGGTQHLTTTTAIRMLLNKAANVDEAVAMLKEYDMHSSLGMMVHFVIADALGNSVVVEYVNNEMSVIETPVVTNFYHTQGDKKDIGTAQSHQRYDILMELLNTHATLEMEQLRDALDSVSKDNFGEFESTEWSIVYNLETLEVQYYHREHYDQRYVLKVDN